MFRYLGAAALLLAAGCLNLDNNANSITLDFDFDAVGADYTPGVAGVSTADLPNVNFTGDQRTLPSPLDVNRKALYLAGTNAGTDLFLYQQRYITGLDPNATYNATLQISYASNFHDGCSTGAGPNTAIKAGVSEFPLESAPDNQGVLRLNVDVGTPTTRGDFTALGDIRNGLSGCPSIGTYATRASLSQQQDIDFTTDIAGGFVLWVGIHTSALARTELYITSLRLVIF